MSKMKIEIWSDIACPFCYIGKKKMEQALSQFSESDNVELEWHSYELNPSLPKSGLSQTYYQYLAEMHDYSEEEAKADFKDVLELADSVGLKYNPDNIVVANTSDALRLTKLAAKYGKASEAEEALFKAYFVDGENVADRNVLIKIGGKIGIPAGDINRCLDTFEYSEDINNDIQRAEDELDLEFIPFYLFNNRYVIQGSVSVEDYLKALGEAYNDWKENGIFIGEEKIDVVHGKSCSIDGTCSI
ncbi:MAG: DsbA family oxidoreductase [Dysgonomonas sp.]